MAEHWKQMERMGEGDKTDKKDYALFPIYYVFYMYMSIYVTLNDQGISFFLKSENSKYVVVNRYRSKICRSWIPKRTDMYVTDVVTLNLDGRSCAGKNLYRGAIVVAPDLVFVASSEGAYSSIIINRLLRPVRIAERLSRPVRIAEDLC